MKNRSEQLIQGLLAMRWDPEKNGYLLNELLDAFQKGFQVGNLLDLLNSKNTKIVRAGIWIASELGCRACVLYAEIKLISMSTNDAKIKFYFIDCVLVCAEDGESIVMTAYFLEDVVAFVRWNTVNFLYKLSPKQVQVAIDWMRLNSNKRDEYYIGFQLLGKSDNNSTSVEEISDLLQAQDPVLKKFAIASAIRRRIDREVVRNLGDLSMDEDIVNFCMDLPRY